MSDELLNSLRKQKSTIVRCPNGEIRFLCKGMRTLLEELENFQRSYRDSSDNGGLERKDLMEKFADKFEQGLETLGAMTLKDKLQTANGISYSCNLLKNTMEIIIISLDTEEGA
ncbi:hypothetical protein PPACK8108_LOCUS5937 [Phakopsora pachyrhizi]|uniref:Uncharacterized protein n=1 Tax=Phakopsora pachyrhizi TaxID=170000 RepID=A0AAV0ARV6_PHAPC|nr:hypothetical protein PPACK8108_LOCUS5937 [Phakopsora pachyrhizi]